MVQFPGSECMHQASDLPRTFYAPDRQAIAASACQPGAADGKKTGSYEARLVGCRYRLVLVDSRVLLRVTASSSHAVARAPARVRGCDFAVCRFCGSGDLRYSALHTSMPSVHCLQYALPYILARFAQHVQACKLVAEHVCRNDRHLHALTQQTREARLPRYT